MFLRHAMLVTMEEREINLARKRIGQLGEELACQYLENRGYKVIDRNYRKKWGEIDVIAIKGGIVRFVEVKAVSREAITDISREIDYRPEEMVQRYKLQKLARTATLYMEAKKDTREYQIDVLGIIIDEEKKTARCRLFEQALEDNL